MRLGMPLCILVVMLALLVPGSLAGRSKDSITLPPGAAGVQLLHASHQATRLCELAYPGTFMAQADALDTNLLLPVDQRYKTALTGNPTALGFKLVGFVDRYSASPSVQDPTFLNSRFLHAYVATKPAAGTAPASVHVVFRGTDLSTVSINTDLESGQIPLPGSAAATVHKAFYLSVTEAPGFIYDLSSFTKDTSALDDIKALITTALAQPDMGAGAAIHLTGHFLGAAEAALTAYLLKTDATGAFANIALTTFGMPQVGNQAWRELFGQTLGTSHMRWWNKQDPIVKLPNTYVDFGIFTGHQQWFTVDTLYRIDAVAGTLQCGVPSGTYTVCDERSSSVAPTKSQSCYGLNPGVTGIKQFITDSFAAPDHQIASYKDNLLTCLQAAGGADETTANVAAASVAAADSTTAAAPSTIAAAEAHVAAADSTTAAATVPGTDSTTAAQANMPAAANSTTAADSTTDAAAPSSLPAPTVGARRLLRGSIRV